MSVNRVEFGKTYITTLTLRYITYDGDNQNIKTRAETTITLEITRQLQFDINFTTNNINRDELVINSGETILTEYAASGTIMNPPDGSSNRIESIVERKNNGNPIELTLSSVNTDPAKPRLRWQVSSHADAHGKWETNYSASDKLHSLVYIPDTDRINALTSNDVVISTVSFTICNGNCAGDSGTIEANVLLRKTLTVRIFGSGAQKVELDWDSEFSGIVTKRSVNAHYVDREGTVDSFKITSIHKYDIQVTESKAGTADIVVDSGRASAELEYSSTHYARNLVYGTWFFANDNNRFLFRPNSDAINNLNPGESVTSTMSISVYVGTGTTNIFDTPKTISYTIQAPQTTLSWSLGTTGTTKSR